MRDLTSQYNAHARSIAQELADAVESGEITEREQMIDSIHERVDGDEMVTYTQQNFVVLLCSSHHDAITEYGDEEPNWSRLAYAALEQDVLEYLPSVGIDINADDLGLEEEEEEEDADDQD